MTNPAPLRCIIQCSPLSGYPLTRLPPGRACLCFTENRLIYKICSTSFSIRQWGWIKTRLTLSMPIVFFLDLTASIMQERHRFLTFLKMPSQLLMIRDKASSVNVLWGRPTVSSSRKIKVSMSSGFSFFKIVEYVTRDFMSSLTFRAMLWSS